MFILYHKSPHSARSFIFEMGVFTELAKRPEDLSRLQGRLGLHPRSGRDFFDALVALGSLRRINGKYANIAPARSIEPWKDTAKFVLNFAEPAKEISPIQLVKGGRGKALQNLRYTNRQTIERAETLDDIR
jgi:hypothetical protein